jgi:hypothetical protein
MNTQATTIEPTVAGETAKAFLECPYRSRWAHLGFGSCAEALLEIERLKVENRDLRRVFEQATVAFRKKEEEIKGLKAEIGVLRHKLRDQFNNHLPEIQTRRKTLPIRNKRRLGRRIRVRKNGKSAERPRGTAAQPGKNPTVRRIGRFWSTPANVQNANPAISASVKKLRNIPRKTLFFPVQSSPVTLKNAAIAAIAARCSSQLGQVNAQMVISDRSPWLWPGLCDM